MIDKLDLRVPAGKALHPEFNRLYAELRSNPHSDPFHRTKHYDHVADLRPYGYEAVLHLGNRHQADGKHKLELVDTGKMTYAAMVNEIERIFQADATKLGVMRVDLATDIPGIPVTWFQPRVKVRHKQYLANIGSAEFVEMGKGGVQTLYFGRRPNLIRIYDKLAKYRAEYGKLTRKLPRDSSPPSFEELYGVPKNGHVLTRVERQIGGGKVPEELATVGNLAKAAPDFHPFDAVSILTGGKDEPNPDHYSFETYCSGMHLREMAERHGMQATMKFIARQSKRNTQWALEKYRDFLPVEDDNEMVNTDYLNERYRLSVTKQLRNDIYVIQ